MVWHLFCVSKPFPTETIAHQAETGVPVDLANHEVPLAWRPKALACRMDTGYSGEGRAWHDVLLEQTSS